MGIVSCPYVFSVPCASMQVVEKLFLGFRHDKVHTIRACNPITTPLDTSVKHTSITEAKALAVE